MKRIEWELALNTICNRTLFKSFVLALFLVNFSACGLIDELNGDPDTGLRLNNNEDDLAGEVEVSDDPLDLDDSAPTGVRLAAQPPGLTLTLKATASQPVVDGVGLHATDVFVDGKFAYVSYNVEGQVQKGSIRVFDVNKINNPRLISQLDFSNTDINAVHVDDIYVYVATTGDPSGAFVSEIKRNKTNGKLTTQVYAQTTLPSFAANDVTLDADVYVTSGDTAGALTILEKASLSILGQIGGLADPRSVSVIPGTKHALLFKGQPGSLERINLNDPASPSTVWTNSTIGGANIAESKARVYSVTDYSIVSTGDTGFSVVCNSDGVVIGSEDAVVLGGVDPSLTVTNAVSLDGNLVFASNGEAGAYVYTISDSGSASVSACNDRSLTFEGKIQFANDPSVNHIHIQNSVAYVAAGDGLKIVEVK